MQYEQKTIQLSNGQKINFVEFNPQGKTDIIFVHGNFSSWTWWKDVLEVMVKNQNYHVIAIDQRGFGKSTYKNPVVRFTQHAQDIKNFIQLKGLKDVVLIGWSYGGGISMKTAQIAPELISKIIPTASVSHSGLPFINDKGQQLHTREQILTMPRFAYAEQVRKDRNYQAQKNIFELVLFQKLKHLSEQRKKQLIECSFDQAEYLDVLTALANPDIDISKIKAKALMIHGKQDPIIKLQSVLQTAKLLGNNMEIWEDHYHMLPIQDVQRYVQRITQFIDLK